MKVTFHKSKLVLNRCNLVKSNRQLCELRSMRILRYNSSIPITLKQDELFTIRSKHEKLYKSKYFDNQKRDEFESKLLTYFEEIGIDHTKILTKIAELDHPSIKVLKFYANNYKNELVQSKKLVLNLFAHSLNRMYATDNVTQHQLQSQLTIGEIVQLFHVSQQIHGNLIHLTEFDSKSLHDGNKLSILSGDFLLAIVMKLIAKISDSDVTKSLTDAFENLNIGQYVLYTANDDLLANMHINKWLELTDLLHAFCFKKGCESIAHLIASPVKVKHLACEFGRNFAIALQASTELLQLENFIDHNQSRIASFIGTSSSSIEPSFEDLSTNGELASSQQILNLDATHIDFFQLPIILDCDNLTTLVRKVINNAEPSPLNNMRPMITYELLKDHLNCDFPKTKQFIQLYAKKSIDCFDSLFSESNHLETNELLKDFLYSCLYFQRK